jgi:dipeptidyl aminopeptidase/acylaminoacyl peptidase
VRFSLTDPGPETFVSLTRVWERTTIRPDNLTPAQDFRWQSVGGMEIQGWLYRAVGRPRGTILHIHGGPTAHSEDKINPQIQFFVAQGFNVLDPNYRGSTGFSLSFQEAIKEDGWGGREQEDIRTGIESLIAAGIAEPGRVGVTGTSYGGYSSWCAITHCPRELVAAAAPICGMTDLVVDYETTRPDLRPYSEEMIGGRPDQVPERYRERSPIYFVSNIKGQLLIVQGLRDPNVTPENVRVVTGALQQAGVEYQLLTFEDEGHGIGRPRNQRMLYARLAAFFEDAFEKGERM